MTRQDVPGTFNVAADDIVTLSQALRKLGRPTVGVPAELAPMVSAAVRQARLIDFSADQIHALTYGRAMDTSQVPGGDRLRLRRTRAWPPWRSSSPRVDRVCSAGPGSMPVWMRSAGWSGRGGGMPDAEIFDFDAGRRSTGPRAVPTRPPAPTTALAGSEPTTGSGHDRQAGTSAAHESEVRADVRSDHARLELSTSLGAG